MASISKSERAYIQTSLQAKPPFRADGRGLTDYRTVFLETGVAPLANGSARVNLGKSAHEGGGGTEVIAAVKLEVEDVENGDGVDGGYATAADLWHCLVQTYEHGVREGDDADGPGVLPGPRPFRWPWSVGAGGREGKSPV